MAFTVATYNVHRCIGRDGRFDPGRVLAVLAELDADVVALQELLWDPQEALHLLDNFATALNYHAIPGPTLLRGDGHYGNAILTRLPVRSVSCVDISVPKRELRGALDVVLANAHQDLRVIATHLGLGPGERRKQMRQLLGRLGDNCDIPTVFMGDINEWFMWGRPLRWLHAYFGYTPAPATYPARFPFLALDRIWTKPSTQMTELTAFDSPMARAASDHLPLRAVIKQ